MISKSKEDFGIQKPYTMLIVNDDGKTIEKDITLITK
jgi:hypothetical protein